MRRDDDDDEVVMEPRGRARACAAVPTGRPLVELRPGSLVSEVGCGGRGKGFGRGAGGEEAGARERRKEQARRRAGTFGVPRARWWELGGNWSRG